MNVKSLWAKHCVVDDQSLLTSLDDRDDLRYLQRAMAYNDDGSDYLEGNYVL